MSGFRAAVAKANAEDSYLAENGARLEFLHHDDSADQAPDIEIAAAMCRLLAESGGDGRIHPGPFCCDMRHLVNQGAIPSIIFGPGAIAQAHKADEYIGLPEYLQCIDHLVEFIPRWCGVEEVH
jgi:acetylornithine deacetylase